MIVRPIASVSVFSTIATRSLHDGRARLSKLFLPSGNVTLRSVDKGGGSGHELLLKAGYLRQSSAGIFSLLPLGQIVMSKIERRIDQHMAMLDASKISLPSMAPRKLWELTGRWETSGKELFKVKDRKDAEFCLNPTHEEVVTKLVAAEVNGYRQLPVRVYQIGRKFRDEKRPRAGMLRGKEFLMKDLYTFDDGADAAYQTYQEVTYVYKTLFDSLGVKYYVAEADSGNIGGDLSHEYHLPSAIGEDTLLACSSCHYVANQELAKVRHSFHDTPLELLRFCHQIYRDSIFFEVTVPLGRQLNMTQFTREAQRLDPSLTVPIPVVVYDNVSNSHPSSTVTTHVINPSAVLQAQESDPCPMDDCHGTLQEIQAIEIGHTFHLGQKYSEPLNFKYSNVHNQSVFPEMGCHGIGVSRLLSALAETGHDLHGLKWPRGLEPYKSAIVVEPGYEKLAEQIYDFLGAETVIDDRPGKSIAYKVKDMELIGVPDVFVVGKHFYKLGTNATYKSSFEDLGNMMIERAARGQQQKDFTQVRLSDLRT